MQNINGQAPARDPNAILNECRSIDQGIEGIQRNLERLRFLQQRSLDDPDASQTTATNRELDALSNDTMTMYRNFGARLKTIKSQKESGDPRNRPQVGMVDRKLKNAINEYQQVDRDFRHKLAAQMERQYRIVRPDASEEEVREAVEDTSNNQVFSQAVCPFLTCILSLAPHLCRELILAYSSCNRTDADKPNPPFEPSKAATRQSRKSSARWWSWRNCSRIWKPPSSSKKPPSRLLRTTRTKRSRTCRRVTWRWIKRWIKPGLRGRRSGSAWVSRSSSSSSSPPPSPLVS